VNGKYYVGQTKKKDLHKYFTFKKWCARTGRSNHMPVIYAIAKYGWENFTVDILALPKTMEQMNDLERAWIIVLNSRNPELGYNLAIGGGKVCIPLSEETKAKIGAANKGRKPKGYIRTELHRQQLRDRMKGNKVGKKITAEVVRQWRKNETNEQKQIRYSALKRAWDRYTPEEKAERCSKMRCKKKGG